MMRQMIFYAMTEAETFEPAVTYRSLADIKATGFDSIYLEYRNTRAPFHSSRFQAAVATLCQEARRQRLAVVIDASLNHFAAEMQADHPELFTEPLTPRRVPVRDGHFTLEIGWGDPSNHVLENAWLLRAQGTAWQVDQVSSRCRLVSQVSEGGGCAMTRQRGGAATRQEWSIEGVEAGVLFVVTRHRFAYANRDLGHPVHDGYLGRLCDFAGRQGVDGVVWDEPHFGFDFLEDAYPVSDRLYGVFAGRFGYDLRKRLVDLWVDVDGRDSGQVRLDYAEMLESQLALLEGDFKRRALAHPALGGRKPGLMIGIHRTMHEELSDDFRIGSVDYFRHSRGLTAGCTDSVFEREDSMLTMALLARSLASLSSSGEAWNNSWGFHPTEEHLAYYLRLLGCLNVRWIGHTYHGSLMFGPGYPHHPTWPGMGGKLEVHRGLLDQLADATPEPDTAVLYHWRGLADYPGNYHHQHRRDFLMTCLELGAAQAALTVVDPATLAAGRADVGRWTTALGSFRRILALWPSRLDMAAWAALEQAASAGVEILLVGPPAFRSDTGLDLGARWAALAGCQPVERDAALALPYGAMVKVLGRAFAFDPALAVPNWRSNPENTYADHAQAWELTGGEAGVEWDGRVIGVRRSNITTVTTELPQIPGALSALWPVDLAAPAGLLTFRYTRGDERLLAFCARHAVPVDGNMIWEGHNVLIRNCLHGVLRRHADGRVTGWGEGAMHIDPIVG